MTEFQVPLFGRNVKRSCETNVVAGNYGIFVGGISVMSKDQMANICLSLYQCPVVETKT